MFLFSSAAGRFRQKQAIFDLWHVVARASEPTLDRISASFPGDLGRIELANWLDAPGDTDLSLDHPELYSALLLAAALPADDHDVFITATAILLADRLSGGGVEDFFWHWDAFVDHYRLEQPETRVAIMHGFAQLHQLGLVDLMNPPVGPDLLTEPETAVLARLEQWRSGAEFLEIRDALIHALTGEAAHADITDAWRYNGKAIASLPSGHGAPMIAAFRHIYEAQSAFESVFNLVGKAHRSRSCSTAGLPGFLTQIGRTKPLG